VPFGRCRRAAVALAMLIALGGGRTAWGDGHPPDPRVSFGGGVDVATAYFFRGILRERHGVIVQPYAQLDARLYAAHDYDVARHGPVSSVGVTLGSWNSLHSKDRTGTFHEADLYGGITIGLFDHLAAGAAYTAYLSPNDTFDTIEEIDLSLALDDVEWLGALALRPSATLAHEIDGRALGRRRGTHLQLGMEPTFPLWRRDRHAVSLAIPFVAGLSLGDYYETDGTDDDTWGYLRAGTVLTVPLAFLGDSLGSWTGNVGAHVYTFNDTLRALNDDDDWWVVGSAGIAVAY
jgi:hypothetical protein